MSAVRRNGRRANRNNLSSPYARPSDSSRALPNKKSLWSLSGLINFLNPFGGRGDRDDSDLSGTSDGEVEEGSPPRHVTPPQPMLPPPLLPPQQQLPPTPSIPPPVNGQAASSSHALQAPRNQLPFPLNTPSQFASSASLVKNLEPVTRFLVEKAGQPLNEFEAAGIVDYIQKNVQGSALVPDKPEPFRFSTSPSRGSSPNLSLSSSNDGAVQTPRKTLSRNPNGIYRWQGAGSSRPRNRYQSPGFGPRPQQNRIKLSPLKTPLTTDTKRRRVGYEAESSTPQKAVVPSTSTISFPASGTESPGPVSQRAARSSITVPNGKAPAPTTLAPAPPVTPKANGIQPRLRTTGVAMKPTIPAIPSPLRQAWKQSDSPPQASLPSRPTRAADFMTELIKEVTPTKKADVSNPYQTANPVKPPAPSRKPIPKRPKPSAKSGGEPKEKEPEVSAQAIIEATVPKGSKRSRPPPEMEKATRVEQVPDGGSSPPTFTQPPRFRGAARTTIVVEAITVREEEESPSKKRKTPPAPMPLVQVQEVEGIDASKACTRPAEVIEPDDDSIKSNDKPSILASEVTLSPPPSAPKSLFGGVKTAVPKEPSKLRYSYQADKVEVKAVDTMPATSLAPLFTPPPISFPTALMPAPAPAKTKLVPKDEALAMDVDELPEYIFSLPTTTTCPAGPSSLAARNTVLSIPVSSLPTYEFKPVTAPVRAMNGFNWTAAGLKAPTASGQQWKCKLCGLDSPASATEKCTICDTPRPASTLSSTFLPVPSTLASSAPAPPPLSAPVGPVKTFDWLAAGLALPPKPQSGTWTCSLCSLPNPASAIDKCTVCEAPR
ncbi:hypothetical protein BS17DRAFT_264713 [Gyrodon lividus]|nr:hypothetical protein BS17DRAFT_264713 [Gyrodon lividus]